jgi:hypothetical protein
MKKRRPATVIGAAWYTREGWEQIRALAADPDLLENSYDEWLAMFGRTLSDLNAQGLFPEKVQVDPEKLVSWCKKGNRPIDAAARSEFVARTLRNEV